MGGDLTDTRQQALQGYFSMILYGSFPEAISRRTIRETLLAIDRENPFEVSIKPVMEPTGDKPPDPDDCYVLTARGSDRIGFVALVSGFCAEHGINILDLSTTGRGTTYTMILLVDISKCPPMETLRAHLKKFNKKHGLSMLLQHRDIFKATNEIKMI
jgi:predicted amino acid-binding ACT domain protein